MYVPFLKEHRMTKLKGYMELAPVDLSLSDILCSSWTKIAVNNYTRISTMDLTEYVVVVLYYFILTLFFSHFLSFSFSSQITISQTFQTGKASHKGLKKRYTY